MLHLDDWGDDVLDVELPDDGASDTPAGDELQIINCDQNSEDWDYARMRIPTASAFNKVISGGRADRPSETRRKYMLTLLGERLTGRPTENFSTRDTERGHADEPKAADDYEFRQRVKTETVGFMRRGNIGYSPDRVVVGQRGLVEIKSKKPELQLAILLSDAMPGEHKPQAQGGLMVSGYDWLDFVSYCTGLPLFVKRIYRDEKYIAFLREEIDQFNAELAELETQIVAKHYGGVHPQTGETV